MSQTTKRKTMGERKEYALLGIILYLQFHLSSQNQIQGNGTRESSEKPARASAKEETGSMYHTIMGRDCTKRFWRADLPFPPIAECSLPALFQSYPSSMNLPPFESVQVTDMPLCYGSDAGDGNPEFKHVLNGTITLTSQNEAFINREPGEKRSRYCLRLSIPPFSRLRLRADRVEDWMKSATDVSVGLRGQGFHKVNALAHGEVIRSRSAKVVLIVKGLWEKLKASPSPRSITLVFQAVPWCEEEQLQVDCPKEGFPWHQVDLVFILDASTSVVEVNFERMKAFVKHILEFADIDSGNVRVGVIIYSTEDHVMFHLSSYSTKAEVFNAVDEIRYRYGSTNTADALRTMRTEMYSAEHGDRPGVPDVVFILTDGVSNINSRRTIPEAEAARQEGIHIYAIGIGLTDTAELEGIASKPLEENAFSLQGFSELLGLRGQLFTSFKPGYIQTLNWDGHTSYKPSVNACVTVEAPPSYFIMISFVSLDLQTYKRCSCDFLELYFTPSCSGKPESIMCESSEALPTSRQADVMSVRFKSDASVEKSGFKLLYSFHSPAERPKRLWTGRWDCSGGRGPIMVQHFICSSDTFCVSAEDNAGGCPPPGLCGDSTVQIDDKCYRYMKSSRKVSWEEAAYLCRSNKGHLVSLNTESEWRTVAGFWVNITDADNLMVGLRHSSYYRMPDLYSSLWRWTDLSVAYYFNLSYPNNILSPPYCTVFRAQEQHLTFVPCNIPTRANYLCEMETPTDQDVESSQQFDVTLPEPSTRASNLSHISECPNKDATYTFLQCERSSRCHSGGESGMQECLEQNFLMAETMFKCTHRNEHVHYTLVCDYHVDCGDESDENFCVFPPCPAEDFKCWRTKQCIPQRFHCDGIYHCADRSDEELCWETMQISESSTVVPPAVVHFTGTGSITVTALSNFHSDPVCPETHFHCPSSGYCLPVFVRCNNVNDCPEGEDEADCDSYTCPGFYRCHTQRNCVHFDHLCDGQFQCPRHDDELMCNMTCPDQCFCTGFAFHCHDTFSAHLYPQLRFLNADLTDMKLQDFANNSMLIHLSLKSCKIKEIGIANLPNLQILDLSYNFITNFSTIELRAMRNLRSLSLAFNKLLTLNVIDFVDLTFPGLTFLDISGGSTREISNTTFLLFPNIEHLDLSGSKLQKVMEPGFNTLPKLRVLDISGCPLTEFYGGMFTGLQQLKELHTSLFHMCCPTFLPAGLDPGNCHAPLDEVSSCAALLRADVFRAFLIIYAVFALVGNFFSFVYRVFGKGVTTKLGFDIFVTHLCVSDFLMGVYLAIVGIADRIYYGNYEWNAIQWKESVACQMAGFLSFLSSEVSAFLICFITVERFLLIRFPHRNLRFTPKSAQIACVIGWLVGLMLAAIPFFPFSPPWQFYSQTGICIPLPITRKVFPGSEYSFAVMIVFNFLLFLLIAAGQFLIFWSIRSQTKAVSSASKKAKDMAIARRLLAVVMTDFLCWFPIGLLGLLARTDTPISGDVNIAMAIFVLPFNSALNPFLYTLHMLIERHRSARALRLSKQQGESASISCPACIRREQSLSQNIPSLTKSAEPVHIFISDEDKTMDQEVFRLIEKYFKEGKITPERLQFHLLQMATEENSPALSNTLQA